MGRELAEGKVAALELQLAVAREVMAGRVVTSRHGIGERTARSVSRCWMVGCPAVFVYPQLPLSLLQCVSL